MASVAQFGGYQFDDNVVNLVSLSAQTVRSQRGKRLQRIRRLECEGELIYSDLATILSKIAEVENAFAQDGKDFRYTVNGSLAHSLVNTGSCTGVRVIQPPTFPKGDPAQLATTRTFTFALEATYDDVEDDLVSWQETIETIGDGGPIFNVVDTIAGPFALYTSLTSSQYYMQTGSAVGYINRPTAPAPVNTAGLFGPKSRVAKIGGRNLGNGIRFRGVRWSYFMGRDINHFGGVDYSPSEQ